MPIRFRCPACARRLSIATRKAGAPVACPNCRQAVTVPGPPPADEPASGGGRELLRTACVALVLVGGLAAVLAVALRKPAAPGTEQARVDPPAPIPRLPVQPAEPPVAKLQAAPPVTQQLPAAPVPNEQSAAPQQPPTQQQTPQPPAQQPQPAPPPRPVAAKPPVLDRFGNPVGSEYGLGRDGEFKGQRLLFWCAFENAGKVFFGPANPLWKALAVKGFVVRRAFGTFDPAWLREADQLWILSSGRLELPAGVTPDLLAEAVALLPAEAVPSGLTPAEYQFVVRATLDVAFSPRHALDEKAFRAIEAFVTAGKGLCLLADDEPFTAEADELARRLFGARVGGNYRADRTAFVGGRGLTPAEVRTFGGQFEAADHALLAGVNFLFEGITVSHVTKSDTLAAALAASDGKTLLAVSTVPGRRVVIDCGFTRYCHGPTERTSYISKTAGTVRLGQNVAAYLAGKGAPKP